MKPKKRRGGKKTMVNYLDKNGAEYVKWINEQPTYSAFEFVELLSANN